MAQRPEFSHKRERHGVIGPFSGRQLVFAFAAVLIAVVVLVGVTTPLGNTANGWKPGSLWGSVSSLDIAGRGPS